MTFYKISSIKLSILITVFIVISLFGCFSEWRGDMAQIVISFDGTEYAREAYNPGDSTTHQKLQYKIAFSCPSEMQEFDIKGYSVFEAYFMPGKWNVIINSYLGGVIYATGSKDIILKPGQNKETINMYESFKTEVPGWTLAKKLDWLYGNTVGGGNYLVKVNGTESISGFWLVYGDKKVTITLTGGGTVNLSNPSIMFGVEPNVTLILENITLDGRKNSGKDNSLVFISASGKLIMNKGAVITRSLGFGVNGNGEFIMNGGTISNNIGGVNLFDGGKFDMHGGNISGNNAGHFGGVWVDDSTFEMTGGKIKDNIGGGVVISENGKFEMSGGEISGNTADNGGGVHVWNGIFDKKTAQPGGICEIENNTANDNANVSAFSDYYSDKKRVNNVTSNESLYYNGTMGNGNATGSWDTQ